MNNHSDSEKPQTSPVPIWRCKSSECKAWVREEMASSDKPDCPLCKGVMIRSIKHLPKLVKKAPRKKKTDEDTWLQ